MRVWRTTARAVSGVMDLGLRWASPYPEKGRSGRFAALCIGEGVDEGFNALCNYRVQFSFFGGSASGVLDVGVPSWMIKQILVN